MIQNWKAHDQAIVSVAFIENEWMPLVATASLDKTARLWTIEGDEVGTFGQTKKWSLKKLSADFYPK